MKKTLSLIIIAGAIFLISSCVTMHSGKAVESNACKKIEHKKGNKHHFELTHVLVDYDYSFLKSGKIISIEGNIDKLPDAKNRRTYKKIMNSDLSVLENKELKECYIDIYFLGASRKVLSLNRVQITHSPILYFPMTFKTAYPFNPEYKYIALAYKFVFTSTTPKATSMEKIYTHELDIEKTHL